MPGMRHKKHVEYLQDVQPGREERCARIAALVRSTMPTRLERRQREVVVLAGMSAPELAAALVAAPELLKPFLAACNMGGRALRKDLGIELDPYRPKLDEQIAARVAEFLLPALPEEITLDALLALDLYQFVDSEIRKAKGSWEKQILSRLVARGLDAKKRRFEVSGEAFELDIAVPSKGPIVFGVDVKMIGHQRDIHKRGDEIVNKAHKLKVVYPYARFAAVVYYPGPEYEHLEHRLTDGTRVDSGFRAGDDEDTLEAVADALAKQIREKLGTGPVGSS